MIDNWQWLSPFYFMKSVKIWKNLSTFIQVKYNNSNGSSFQKTFWFKIFFSPSPSQFKSSALKNRKLQNFDLQQVRKLKSNDIILKFFWSFKKVILNISWWIYSFITTSKAYLYSILDINKRFFLRYLLFLECTNYCTFFKDEISLNFRIENSLKK